MYKLKEEQPMIIARKKDQSEQLRILSQKENDIDQKLAELLADITDLFNRLPPPEKEHLIQKIRVAL